MSKKIAENKTLAVGIVLTGLVVLLALVGLFFTPYDVTEINHDIKYTAPCFEHPFGTDNFGRDVFSRVMKGTSLSFVIAVSVVAFGGAIGIFIGALTGYFGGWPDKILMRVNDSLAAFPTVLLTLVIIAVLGTGKYNLVLALGIVFIPSFVRITRGEVIKQKELDYVKNLKLMEASDFRIIFLDILPNIKPAIISTTLIAFQNAILSEAGMSYLGLGVAPPDPSLGRMLSEAQSYLYFAPWYAISPGLIIFLFTLGLGFISHGLAARK